MAAAFNITATVSAVCLGSHESNLSRDVLLVVVEWGWQNRELAATKLLGLAKRRNCAVVDPLVGYTESDPTVHRAETITLA